MRPSLCCLFLTMACALEADDAAGGEYIDEDFPPWGCDTDQMTGTGQPCGTSGGDAELACQSASDCPGEYCAASFNGDIGPFECQSTCIEILDDNRWCSDAEACCDADAICDRGYCIFPDGVGTSSETTSTDPSTSGESGETGSSSSESSSGTGTDTGTGSTGGSSTDGA